VEEDICGLAISPSLASGRESVGCYSVLPVCFWMDDSNSVYPSSPSAAKRSLRTFLSSGEIWGLDLDLYALRVGSLPT